MLAGAAGLSVACGSPARATPTSIAVQHRLAGTVLSVMNHSGLPVMDDYISCHVLPNGHTLTCQGLADDADASEVLATFDAAPSSPAGGSCPGALTVDYKSETVQQISVDPCR
jgi:hypothetical protein